MGSTPHAFWRRCRTICLIFAGLGRAEGEWRSRCFFGAVFRTVRTAYVEPTVLCATCCRHRLLELRFDCASEAYWPVSGAWPWTHTWHVEQRVIKFSSASRPEWLRNSL